MSEHPKVTDLQAIRARKEQPEEQGGVVDDDDVIDPAVAEYEHEDGYVCLTTGGNVFLFCHPDVSGGDDHRALVMSPATALDLAHSLIMAAKSPHLRPATKTPAQEAAER